MQVRFVHRATPLGPEWRLSTLQKAPRYALKMATKDARVREIDELIADMRPPTKDDIPVALNGEVLDTPEKVVEHLTRINETRRRLSDRAS